MMTKKITFLIATCLFFFKSEAQLEEPRPVNLLDFNVEAPNESAIYLINDAHTHVIYDTSIDAWVASTEYFYRIRVLSKDGLDLGNVKVRLYKSGKMVDQRQYLDQIKATTYNFNVETGKIEKSVLSKKKVFRTKVNDNWQEVSFALPNVKVNSVIDIRYTKRDPFYNQLEDWYFQKDHPVVKSRYSVAIAAFFQYVFQLQGQLKTKDSKMEVSKERTPFGRYVYQDIEAFWLMENIPAFRKEPFMTTRDDYISKLVFQLQAVKTPELETTYLKSWEDVTQDLQDDHRFKLFYTGKKDFTAFELSKAPDPLARAKKIYADFKQYFKWDQKFGVHPNVGFRAMMAEKSGNTSSMGLTLFQILEQSGLEAKPVMFSPRFHGKISYNYPFVDRLIATVVRLRIDGKTYLLDPVNNVPFGYLHKDFLNGQGLVLGNRVEWQDLTRGATMQRSSQLTGKLAGDSLTVDIQLDLVDYGMVSSETQVADLFETDWNIVETNIVTDEVTKQSVTAKMVTEIEDDLILFPLKFDRVVFQDNPFESNERLNPIDFYYKKKFSYQLALELSDEYEIESLPKSRSVRTSDSKLNASLNVSQIGSKVNVTFIFWTRTNSFGTQYYPKLKEAYELMAELGNTVIVAKRKT